MAVDFDVDASVANLTRDGSQWAWHISSVRFLQPATWPFGYLCLKI